jgi:hypothetical protein
MIPGVQIDTPREQVVETPKIDIAVTMDVASTTPPLISEITPITQIDIHNTDTMPIEPVTSLLDITEPTPQISILDIGAETIVPDPIITPIIVSTVVEPLVPVQTQPSSQTTQAPISGSL